MGRRMCVLLVDGEPMVRRALRRWLTRDGFEVLEAATRAEAEASCELARVDVALVDVRLGGEEGFEVARALAHHGVAVAVMSSLPIEPAPPFALLRKPIEGRGLSRLLRELVT
ncbi:MAG: response regulator [Polyangiaceae bacterium]